MCFHRGFESDIFQSFSSGLNCLVRLTERFLCHLFEPFDINLTTALSGGEGEASLLLGDDATTNQGTKDTGDQKASNGFACFTDVVCAGARRTVQCLFLQNSPGSCLQSPKKVGGTTHDEIACGLPYIALHAMYLTLFSFAFFFSFSIFFVLFQVIDVTKKKGHEN